MLPKYSSAEQRTSSHFFAKPNVVCSAFSPPTERHKKYKFMDTNTILILEGSKQPFICVSRHYGGFTMKGKTWIYMPLQDAFLRQDWVKKFTAHRKKGGNWNTFIEIIKKEKQ